MTEKMRLFEVGIEVTYIEYIQVNAMTREEAIDSAERKASGMNMYTTSVRLESVEDCTPNPRSNT